MSGMNRTSIVSAFIAGPRMAYWRKRWAHVKSLDATNTHGATPSKT